LTLDASARDRDRDSLNAAGAQIFAGELRKQKQGKSVQNRWCTLINDDAEGPRFVYKKTKDDKNPKGVLALRGAWISIPAGSSVAFQSAHWLHVCRSPSEPAVQIAMLTTCPCFVCARARAARSLPCRRYQR
jgi:hypothetical protein